MFRSTELVAFCEKVYKEKWVYWYGTYGVVCDDDLYARKKKQYPDHYTSKRDSGYKKDIAAGKMCADCVGMIKGFFWKSGKLDGKPVYKANGCPDVSANGMYKLCVKTGKIGTIPDIPGLVVWKSGHIGVYVGNGYTVEMRGFDYDCERNKVTSGKWTNWGQLPSTMLDYDGKEEPDMEEEAAAATEAMLAEEKASEDADAEYEVGTDEVADAEEKPDTADGFVEITGASVYLRVGDAVNYKAVDVVHRGYVLPYVATSSSGWHAVRYLDVIVWVSPKYSRVEGN